MTKDLHVYTLGEDPYTFVLGDVRVHVHTGTLEPAPEPPHEPTGSETQPREHLPPIVIGPLPTPYRDLWVPDPDSADQVKVALESMTGVDLGSIRVRLGADDGGGRLGAVIEGLAEADIGDVDLYVVEGDDSDG